MTLTLAGFDHSRQTDVGRCAGTGGYSDIAAGLQFTIKSATGTILGFGPFSKSTYHPTECVLEGAANVPDAEIYSIEAGRRGSVNFARADLAANNWTAALTLGD